jgi:hypothetical protein
VTTPKADEALFDMAGRVMSSPVRIVRGSDRG